MSESTMPYDVRKETDPLNKMVAMDKQRKELKDKIIDAAGKIYDMHTQIKDVQHRWKHFMKVYEENNCVGDDVSKCIADLSVVRKKYREELRTFNTILRQHVSDLRELEASSIQQEGTPNA